MIITTNPKAVQRRTGECGSYTANTPSEAGIRMSDRMLAACRSTIIRSYVSVAIRPCHCALNRSATVSIYEAPAVAPLHALAAPIWNEKRNPLSSADHHADAGSCREHYFLAV
jgi:hypothetical protein